MVRSRILTDDENAVGVFEIFQLYAAFADSDAFVQRRAARLVAHVRAIRQIVGAELPGKQLIQKRGFIAGSSTRVKRGCVWRRQRVQFARQQLKRFVPFDWFVMGGAFTFQHWVNQAALKLKPVVRLLAQIGD